ncbi:MAG: serine/threonine protein kinase [Gemmataceae bacterium]|nr:serine/threonine protein kinase [Gemmataceae bacterium]
MRSFDTSLAGPLSTTRMESDLSGQVLGDFRLVRSLGHGGMGQVYLAEQLSLKRNVALKLLRPDLAENHEALQRFKKEAESVAQATHPNIVAVHAVGEASGRHFMALEYVEGRNLREYLGFRGTLDLALGLSILRQVASALKRAGELGIVHRDIKPDNILLTRNGEAKVADFGLARTLAGQQQLNLTQSGMTLGTPLYMAPEQVEGKQVDIRTDVYSLGVTAYHMFAGKPPYSGENAFEVALKHVKGEAELLEKVRPDLPGPLCQLITRMMSVDIASRPQSFVEILKELETLSRTHPMAGAESAGLPGWSEMQPLPGFTLATEPFQPKSWTPGPWLRRIVVLAAMALFGLLVATWTLEPNNDLPPLLPGNFDPDEEPFDYSRREETLRDAADQYLNLNGAGKGGAGGVGLCIDLGILYFGKHQLDEAEKLFLRCEKLAPYQFVGRVGLGIVYALQDQPEKSMEFFRTVPNGYAMNLAEMNPALRYWILEAIHYNLSNARNEISLTGYLKTLRENQGKRPGELKK